MALCRAMGAGPEELLLPLVQAVERQLAGRVHFFRDLADGHVTLRYCFMFIHVIPHAAFGGSNRNEKRWYKLRHT